MNTQEIFSMLWAFANSPIGVTLVSGVFLFLLNRLYAAKPGWAKFEGTIISAIQYAEKAIPDSTSSRGMARLDAALQYVINVHQQATGGKLSGGRVAEIKEGIQIVHDRLSEKGTLSK
jgi:hypothetical protein